MKIDVSDELLKGINITAEQAVLDFAIGLYSEGTVTAGRAAEVARMSQTDFIKELGKRHIPIHYDVQDLQEDISVVRDQQGHDSNNSN